MARNKANRKYHITINNPLEHGYDHETIKRNLTELAGCVYWCLCDEIGGESGTYHTHIYVAYQNAKEFFTMKRRFACAHIEEARGSHQDNRNYIRKEGKWVGHEKEETNLPETFEESGELPEEDNRRTRQSDAVLALIEEGASNADILRAYPTQINHLPRLDQARQALLEDKFRSEFRQLHVVYIWGKSGIGKTRSIMEEHGYKNVFRVTDYDKPFDGYNGEDILLLDEFRSSLPFSLALNVLDGYPLMLPARYAKRVACYTKVYIVSNIPLDKQYPNIRFDEPDSYAAFLRRIHENWEMLPPAGSDEPF